MNMNHSQFDGQVRAWGRPVYQLCFLLTERNAEAEKAAFQAFLYIAGEDALNDGRGELIRLCRWAIRACEDCYYQKPRRKPSRRRLSEAALPFPIEEPLYRLMRLSFRKRAAFWLKHVMGLSDAETALVLKTTPARASSLAGPPDEAARTAALAIAPREDWLLPLCDNLYLRFAERSVGVENRLRRLKHAFDTALPWIALTLVLLGAAAVWYAGRLNAAAGL